MPKFRRGEIWTDLQAGGGTRKAVIPDLISLQERRRLSGDDELTVVLPRESNAWAEVLDRRVVRVVYDDDSFDEWRIRQITEVRSPAGLVGTLACDPPLLDLARVLVRRLEGVSPAAVVHDFEAVELSPAKHLSEYILNALTEAGLSYWAAGTITPTTPLDQVYAWDTALSALRRLAEATNHELRVRRNGTTQYLVDLLTAIGSGATVVRVQLGKNLLGVTRARDATEQTTRVYPRGTLVDELHATMAAARWKVSAVAGSNVDLVDPDGRAAPVQFDDQLNGRYLQKSDGTLTEITDSTQTNSRVTVASATGIAVGNLVQIRETSAGDDLTWLESPADKTTYGLKAGVLDRPDLPATVNLVPNSALRTWPGAVPDNWTKLGGATLTKTTTAGRWRHGEQSSRVQGAADGEGIESNYVTIAPTAERPYFSGFGSFYIVAGTVRVEMVATDGTTTWILPDGSAGKAFSNEQEVWKDIGVAGIDLKALGATGATQVKMRIVQDGATALDAYVDAAQITQTQAQDPFIEGAGPNRLWQAANEALVRNGAPLTHYDVDLLEVGRADDTLWPDEELAIGGDVKVVDAGVLGGSGVQVRVLEIRRNLLSHLQTSVVLSNRPEDMSDEVARPRRPPRRRREPDTAQPPTVEATFIPIQAQPGVLQVRLSARPTGATIRYKVQAVSTTPPIIGAAGFLTYTNVFNLSQLESEDQVLYAYAQRANHVSSVESWRIPQDEVPALALSLSEPSASTIRATVTVDDDVVLWHLYMKAGGWPTLDGTTTGVLDQAQQIGRIHVREDGGSVDRTGAPLAGMVDASGNVLTGIGGTRWQEGGHGTSNMFVIAVPLDRRGNVGARASANKTLAGSPSAALTAFTAAKTAAGSSCASPAQITVSWTVNAQVSDGTHDLKIYRRRDGGGWSLVKTEASPVTQLSYVDNTEDYESVGSGTFYDWDYRYELVDPAIVNTGQVAAPISIESSGTCPLV